MQYLDYLVPFFIALITGLIFTALVRRFAWNKRIIDDPQKQHSERKIHTKPIPLLGGLAIFLTFTLVVAYYAFFTDRLLGGYLLLKHLIGIFMAGGLIMIGGYLDDKKDLPSHKQIMWPILACAVVIGFGIGVDYITHPFGGTLNLDQYQTTVFSVSGLPYQVIWLADVFALIWLMGMMYTTKFLDGLDGLVSGICIIGSLIIFFLSLKSEVGQRETALLAVIFAGAVLGFWFFNFHPAKSFLGEGGALYCGFILGILSIVSGGKIATALLIMGIPILDVIWVVLRRIFWEKRSPFKTADKKHLHFRLLDVGLSQRQAVLLLYFLTAIFGISGLFLQGKEKFYTLLILAAVMLAFAIFLLVVYRVRGRSKQVKIKF